MKAVLLLSFILILIAQNVTAVFIVSPEKLEFTNSGCKKIMIDMTNLNKKIDVFVLLYGSEYPDNVNSAHIFNVTPIMLELTPTFLPPPLVELKYINVCVDNYLLPEGTYEAWIIIYGDNSTITVPLIDYNSREDAIINMNMREILEWMNEDFFGNKRWQILVIWFFMSLLILVYFWKRR